MTVNEYCKKMQRSKTTLELIDLLSKYSTEDDFILGVLADSPYDDDRKLIIDFIKQNIDVNYESIILFSLELAQMRDKM